jgi:hypothetical protein
MRANGFELYQANIPIYVGERGRIISVDLTRLPTPGSSHTTASSTTQGAQSSGQPAPPQSSSPLPWVVVGIGGAGLAVGAVFGLAAIHQHDVACPNSGTLCSRDEYDKGLTQADMSTVFFVAGGALVAGGLLWHFLTPSKPPSAESTGSVSLSVGYRSVGLQGSFE